MTKKANLGLIISTALVFLALCESTFAESKMYWVSYNGGKIMRSNLDGSEVEILVSGLSHPSDIAVDLSGGKIYWTVTSSGPGKIQRANLDGSEVEDLVTTGLLGPIGIDVDILNQHIYWVDPYSDKIQRANLDGSDVIDAVHIPGSFTYPYDIALDVAEEQIYWTDWGTDKIQRAGMDGSGLEYLVTTGLNYPCGIVLDKFNGKMFWTDYGTDSVKCANLDGTNVENIITSGLNEPTGIDINLESGKIYIVDYKGRILRSNLDGSGLETLISGLNGPWDIDLAITPHSVEVAVDIKPQSCPNPLNVKSKGILPIAILGTDDYDVITIDPTSIRLAGVEPLRSGYEDVATPVSDSNDCNCMTTESPDGFLDLTLKFETQRIVEAIGDVNDGDVLELPLTGVLSDETPIEGADCILIRGRHKPINPADINKDGVVNAADFAIFTQNWLQSSIVDE